MKVSVAMITYNHESFIAKAIESVLTQETNFEIELIIAEDCSTDHTREIVQDYHQRHPNTIKLLLPDHNLGARQNSIAVLEACTGKYTALLEGDDYWTDPCKLQMQVDYMDSHPDCSICCHRAGIFYDGTPDDAFSSYWPAGVIPADTGLNDLLRDGDYIPTCSALLRRALVSKLPAWYARMPVGDWPLMILHAQHGHIHFLNRVMAAYRRHPGGVTSNWGWDQEALNRLEIYRALWRHLDPKHRPLLQDLIGKFAYFLAIGYEERGDIRQARKCAFWRIAACHFCPPAENPIRHYVRLQVPWLHCAARHLKGKR